MTCVRCVPICANCVLKAKRALRLLFPKIAYTAQSRKRKQRPAAPPYVTHPPAIWCRSLPGGLGPEGSSDRHQRTPGTFSSAIQRLREVTGSRRTSQNLVRDCEVASSGTSNSPLARSSIRLRHRQRHRRKLRSVSFANREYVTETLHASVISTDTRKRQIDLNRTRQGQKQKGGKKKKGRPSGRARMRRLSNCQNNECLGYQIVSVNKFESFTFLFS